MGMDFLESNKCIIDTEAKSLQIKGVKHPIPLHQPVCTSTENNCIWAVLSRTIEIPGHSEVEVMAKVSSTSQGDTLFLEGRFLPQQPSILVAAAVVTPMKGQEIPIRLMNWTPDLSRY